LEMLSRFKDGLTNLKTTWKYTLINTDKFKY